MLTNYQGNKNLVILCAGDYPAHIFWNDTSEKNYDLLIIYYGKNSKTFLKKYNKFDYFHQQSGYKFSIIKDYYKNNKALFKKYKNIFMPDDDLVLKNNDINKFFDIFNDYNLKLAQPSLIGYFSHNITLHRPDFILRYTDFVEIMMPCFSIDALKICINSFDETPTGFGLDFYWPKLLGYPKNKIAIIDEIIAIHPKEVGTSELYNNRKNIDDSFHNFMKKNNLINSKSVFGNVKKSYEKSSRNENYYPYQENFRNKLNKFINKKEYYL